MEYTCLMVLLLVVMAVECIGVNLVNKTVNVTREAIIAAPNIVIRSKYCGEHVLNHFVP